MWIKRIKLKNFRVYNGECEVVFSKKDGKNISLIAGRNGYGKTSFLTSLIWGMYGGLMSQVEDKYKKDIRNSGGYSEYLDTLVNRSSIEAFNDAQQKKCQMSVEVLLADVMIPSIPCREVLIKRTYDFRTKSETLQILIDGQENELTSDIGYEIFINDFILPREIAKFFFFDAEKIVSLAEARTTSELRSLSKAYSEVLGIKKYEDLKKSLTALITKLRRSGATSISPEKLKELETKQSELKKLLDRNETQQAEVQEDIDRLRLRFENIQEQLIRQGNSMTLDELKALEKEREQVKKDIQSVKGELRKHFDILPFYIAKTRFKELVKQIELELEIKRSSLSKVELAATLKSVEKDFGKELKKQLPKGADVSAILKALNRATELQLGAKHEDVKGKIMLDFDEATSRSIISTYEYVTTSFPKELARIKKKEQDLKQLLGRIQKKIKQGEARKDDPVTLKLREDKADLQKSIEKLEAKLKVIIEEAGELKGRYASNAKVLSETDKQYQLFETDKKKHDATVKTLDKVERLIVKIKEEKKFSLQKSILFGFKKLMHKSDFIHDVRVRIEGDIMDVDLLDAKQNVIDKDTLSKGEQQLYASALLKALVDESGINFPVFIDSPLQKFDKQHSKNVILQFYPSISDQVVLFPLLEKELSENEFEILKPRISNTYLITNGVNGSAFKECKPSSLFTKFNEQDVYAH